MQVYPAHNLYWNDPSYKNMWYLTRAREYSGSADMNVQEAWALGYSGKGVIVSILDDGIDYKHPDLRENYDAKASMDLNGEDTDPLPNFSDPINKHGTRCAGEVAASGNNSVCIVGVAFKSRIGGVRMLDGDVTDRIEASALGFRNDYIDIYSGSWGPDDNGLSLEGPARLASRAIENGIKLGRSGLGSIYVWASGNGGKDGDSCSADGYVSSMYTLAVSSVTQNNRRPWYLEECSSILISTYSSGSPSERKISTVDLMGGCTHEHSGTSASAPIAAGIVALVLEANPKLSWRDVQYLSVITANTAPILDGNFQPNGAGYLYSSLYGFGLMDAGKMVRFGKIWKSLPSRHSCDSGRVPINLDLRDKFSIEIPLNTSGCRERQQTGVRVEYLEHVQMYFGLTYSKRGDLRISLVSPSGTVSVLLPYRMKDYESGSSNLDIWPLMSVQFWGENPVIGTWKIRIDNAKAQNRYHNGNLQWMQLLLHGTDQQPIRVTDDLSNSPFSWLKVFTSFYEESSSISVTEITKCNVHNTNYNECLQRSCTAGYAPVRNSKTNRFYCAACHPTCLTCSTGQSESACLSCSSKNLYIPKLHKCVSNQCPIGYFQNSSECLSCPAHCELCSSASRCDACASSFVLNNNAECVSKCPVGTFADKLSRCRDCHNSCEHCLYNDSPNNCTSCNAGLNFLPTAISRVNSTPTGQCIGKKACALALFYNESASACVWCPPNCDVCNVASSTDGHSSMLTCQVCENSFHLLSNGTCIDSADLACPQGFFFSFESGICTACHNNCHECFGPSSNQCLSCKSQSVLYNHQCLSQCPSSHYLLTFTPRKELQSTQIYSRKSQCLPCHIGCASCGGGDDTDCIACSPGFTYDADFKRCSPPADVNQSEICAIAGSFLLRMDNASQCLQQCPEEGYYSSHPSHLCLPCPGKCRSCLKGSGLCTACYIGWELGSNGQCDRNTKCHANEYFNISLQNCHTCPVGCSRCDGPDPALNCFVCARDHCRTAARPSQCFPCCEGSLSRESQPYCQDCILGSELCKSWNSDFQVIFSYVNKLLPSIFVIILFFILIIAIVYGMRYVCFTSSPSHHQHVRYHALLEEEGQPNAISVGIIDTEEEGSGEDVLFHSPSSNAVPQSHPPAPGQNPTPPSDRSSSGISSESPPNENDLPSTNL